jgi:hypothetical protein
MQMKLSPVAVLISASALVAGCATNYTVSPIADSSQQIRYEQGTPTTYSEKKFGAVQVTALGINSDKRPVFGVAAFNKEAMPSNFGVENMSLAEADGTQDKIFTSGDLIHEAKVQAEWAEVGTVLAGAAAAYGATQSAYSTTRGTAFTPYGPVSYSSRTYDPAVAYAGSAAAGVATGASLEAIKNSLDHTIEAVRGNVLQTTTIEPGNSYGGNVVADSLSSSTYPQDIELHISWNGNEHVFKFVVAKGTAAVVPQSNTETPVPAVFQATTSQAGSPSSGTVTEMQPPASTEKMQTFDQWERKNGKAPKSDQE